MEQHPTSLGERPTTPQPYKVTYSTAPLISPIARQPNPVVALESMIPTEPPAARHHDCPTSTCCSTPGPPPKRRKPTTSARPKAPESNPPPMSAFQLAPFAIYDYNTSASSPTAPCPTLSTSITPPPTAHPPDQRTDPFAIHPPDVDRITDDDWAFMRQPLTPETECAGVFAGDAAATFDFPFDDGYGLDDIMAGYHIPPPKALAPEYHPPQNNLHYYPDPQQLVFAPAKTPAAGMQMLAHEELAAFTAAWEMPVYMPEFEAFPGGYAQEQYGWGDPQQH